jgi:prolyl-tRNA synthetase
MKQSLIFFKTRKSEPKDETSVNAKLLIKGNFIHKLMSGVYSFLPLGYRVRSKIINIIEEEMNKLGANQMLMPALHPRSSWEVSGRWEGLSEIMYQFKDHSGKDVGLGATHEEIIAEIAKNIISSYTDLPKAIYQIQTKFRDEKRAKSGILRGKEFTMKDLYSFHENEASLNSFYEQVKERYSAVFKRVGLVSYVTEASGGSFSKDISHEFMVETEVGEDEIYLCRFCGFARNKEISDFKKNDLCVKCNTGILEKVNAVEVGNIFKLGTKYSSAVNLNFMDKDGDLKPVFMGSYGIGIERLMGTLVEVYHDDKGIIWPKEVSPFLVHLLSLGDEEEVENFSGDVYNFLIKNGIEVLWDERKKMSAGEKFYDADLIGCPLRFVVSKKLAIQKKVEIKERKSLESKLVLAKDILKFLKLGKFINN